MEHYIADKKEVCLYELSRQGVYYTLFLKKEVREIHYIIPFAF